MVIVNKPNVKNDDQLALIQRQRSVLRPLLWLLGAGCWLLNTCWREDKRVTHPVTQSIKVVEWFVLSSATCHKKKMMEQRSSSSFA
jgi:hypothetical protein